MTTAYLKSYGPNSVVVVSMIFESFVDGMKFLTDNTPALAGEWTVKEMDDGTRCGYLKHPSGGYIKWEDEAFFEDLYNKIYTSWYFGCGGPGPIVLREMPPESDCQPLCGFDLD